MKRINKKFRNSWWYQWNYSAPLYWICDWFKKQRKKISRLFMKTSAILVGIWLSMAAPAAIEETYAEFESHKAMVEKENRRIAEEAKAKEQAYIKYLNDIEIRKKHNEEERQKEQARIEKEIEDEIKNEYGLYSWIEITWWGDKSHTTGPDAPGSNSRTGQILKIQGRYIYGSWGDEVLNYEYDHFGLISKKEYLDIRQKEQKKKDRENAKKSKKFKSWGLYPGTIKGGGKQ